MNMNVRVENTQDKKGTATVWINEQRIIMCRLQGFISGAVVRSSVDQTTALAKRLRDAHSPVYLLIDSNGVTGQDSGARSVAKELGHKGLDRVAVINRNLALDAVIHYLLRSAGMLSYAKVFRRTTSATRWLLHAGESVQDPYRALRSSIGAVVACIAALSLVGWAIHNSLLTSVVPSRIAINPVAALCLLLLSLSLVLIVPVRLMTVRVRWILVGIASLVLMFGLLTLMQAALNTHWHIDDWLFSNAIATWQTTGHVTPRSGLLLMLVGVMVLCVLTGQPKAWQKYVFHAATTVIFLLSTATIVGAIFHANGVHLIPQMPMPINTALCLLLISYALQTAAVQLSFFERSWNIFTKYSQAIFVFLAILTITGVAWQQTRDSQQSVVDASARDQFNQARMLINNRVSGYEDALRGYRSFFESSDFVAPGEFKTFFDSSDLGGRYPGFTAINFARSVPASQRANFTAEMKQQASNDFPKYNNFAIFPASNQAVSYPVIYVEPHTPTTTFGFDLATDATRRAALQTARDTGVITATSAIDLNASRADSSLPKRPGFFITIPVYKADNIPANGSPTTVAGRRAAIYGFVDAVFEDSKLFADIFKNYNHKDVSFVIRSASSDDVLYRYNAKAHVLSQPAVGSVVNIAGQKWRLALYTPAHYGISRIDRALPGIIVAGGITLAVLAAALVASQTRRREQAVRLASDMTEDLNNERNAAVILQEKDEAILSSIGDAVFALDAHGTIMLFNPVAERLTGQAASEVLGKPYQEVLTFYSEKDGSAADGFIRDALAGKRAEMAQNTALRRKDGATVPVADSAAPILNAEGEVDGVVVVFRDVRRERELMKLKDDFVSIASHELRTPMGAVRAFVAMILAGDYGPVNPNLVEPLNDIKSSTLRLVHLVNDLLDAARIEAGRMKFAVQDMDALVAAKEVASSLAPLGREKGIAVTFQPGEVVMVQADPDKLKQVLTNLVGNSLKFTDKGSITLSVAQQPDIVEITVTDTGMGIAADEQATLFGKFQQISSAQTGRPAGTGLGLYISREIVRKMGGELWLKRSEPGKGSVFALALPRSGTIEAQHVEEQLAHEAGLHPDQK